MTDQITPPPLKAIEEGIREIEGTTPEDLQCLPLAGDASDRRYFRVLYKADGESRRLVVMDVMDVQNICKSEEVTLYHDDAGDLPFLNIHRFLKSIDAPVPDVLYFNREKGIMLLSDLGDALLFHVAMDGDDTLRKKIYEQAVDALVELQVKSEQKRIGSGCVAFDQTFAAELLAWEFEHYLEYGIEALHKVTIDPADRVLLKNVFGEISRSIAALPKVFTHRDYHSRNLIQHKGRPYMIDFQDALFGPHHYDLASLLRDSYIDLGPKLRGHLIDYYLGRYEQAGGEPFDPVIFRKNFDRVAMQRNLKAAGRFVFIDQVKGNPSYLEAIPRTLGYVAEDLCRHADLAEAAKVLIRYEPRLAGVAP